MLGLPLIRYQLVTRRDGDVDSDTKGIAEMLAMVGLFNHDVATADVIAKAIEPRGFVADQFFELI